MKDEKEDERQVSAPQNPSPNQPPSLSSEHYRRVGKYYGGVEKGLEICFADVRFGWKTEKNPSDQRQASRKGGKGAVREDGGEDAQEARGEGEEAREEEQASKVVMRHGVKRNMAFGGICGA